MAEDIVEFAREIGWQGEQIPQLVARLLTLSVVVVYFPKKSQFTQ